MKLTIPPFVALIIHQFVKSGFEIYVVGGAVRDLLMGKQVKDWDLTTNATPEEILEMFPEGFYDNAFGTVGLVDPEDRKKHEAGEMEKVPVYEVTTFRKEVGYSDRRHPDKVEWGQTLEEDLMRRDFTINAMALKLTTDDKQLTTDQRSFKEAPTPVMLNLIQHPRKHPAGPETSSGRQEKEAEFEILDFYNGQEDLKSGLIRAVGSPGERFEEDALRMMRAVRIAAQLGFVVEEKTLKAMQESAGLIQQIAAERIRDELFKLLVTEYPADGVRMLAGTGLMEYILPEMLDAQGVDQSGHHTDDVWEHSLKSLQLCPSEDPVVRLATLIHDVGKPRTRGFVCGKCGVRFKTPALTEHTPPSGHPSLEGNLKCPKCGQENDYYESVTFYNHEMEGAKMTARIADRLRLSNRQKEKLVTLVRWHMFSVDERQTEKAVRRFIKNVGKEYLEDILALRTGDRLGGGARETSWRLERFKKLLVEVQKQPFTVHDLKVDGHDVMEQLKIKPGKQIGEILNQLFAEVEDKKVKNEREDLLTRMKELANSSTG